MNWLVGNMSSNFQERDNFECSRSEPKFRNWYRVRCVKIDSAREELGPFQTEPLSVNDSMRLLRNRIRSKKRFNITFAYTITQCEQVLNFNCCLKVHVEHFKLTWPFLDTCCLFRFIYAIKEIDQYASEMSIISFDFRATEWCCLSYSMCYTWSFIHCLYFWPTQCTQSSFSR